MRLRGAFCCAAVLALAARLSGQDAAPRYETPVSEEGFEFRWDALVRYDDIQIARQAVASNISRWRMEVRPELDWKASDRFRLGVRVLGELSSDSNATNDKRLDNYRSNNAALDRAFLEARPGNFTITAGQFGMPLRTTEMLWDRDLQVLGAAAGWRLPFSTTSALSVTAGFFRGPQREHDDSHIAAGQLTWTFGDPDSVALDWSESYWRFTHLQNAARHFVRQNVAYSVPPVYANDFRIVDSLARVRFAVAAFPVSFSFDWARNLAADENAYRDAFEAALRIGREGNRGDFQVFDVYQSVDRDAVVGAYNTDDWWFHSWYVGHRVGVSYTVVSGVEIRPSVVFQRRQDRKHYLNRYLFDLVKTF
ncbi:MAG: putative porin [Thermoanaerobaculia bacterium]